jgi:hypothetical protein
MKEIWKDIPGYEGYYQVSNLGNVKSLERIIIKSDNSKMYVAGKTFTPKKNSNGYLSVTFNVNQKKSYHSIHRLVLKTFLSESNLHVNHIDGNKHNNVLENLEYVTHLENMNHCNRVLHKRDRYGVVFNKKNNKWVVTLHVKDERRYIGAFKNIEEAYSIFVIVYFDYHGVSPW